MSVLPPQWKTVSISAVCQRTRNRTINPLSHPDEEFEYYSIPAFQTNGRPVCERGSRILSNKIVVEDRTVLFGKLNPRVLKVWLVDSQIPLRKIATTEFLPILANNDAHPEFLYFLCQSAVVAQEAMRLVSGSTPSRERVDPGAFYRIHIPLPPLPEQRAIAAALRAVQDARDARRRELDAERERKAALMEDLFACGLRGESKRKTEIGSVPQSWELVSLGSVAELVQYGTSEKCDADESGIPVLRIPNVIGGRVDVADLKYAKLPEKVAEGLRLVHGDLLFVRTNGNRENTGRCSMYDDDPPSALFASYLIRARLDTGRALPRFVQLYTMTRTGKQYLSGRASNAADGKFNINSQTIKGVQMPLPPLDEQRDIAEVLTACDAKIVALEAEAALHDELFRALLEELMSGRVSARPLIPPESQPTV